MKRNTQGKAFEKELDDLIEEIVTDAYGDDEQLWAFRQAFEDNVRVPCDGSVIGEPVSVIEFTYDGNPHRGLTARCSREDGSQHVVAAADVVLPQQSIGARYIAAYRKWMGLKPLKPPRRTTAGDRKRKPRAASNDLGLAKELPPAIDYQLPRMDHRASRNGHGPPTTGDSLELAVLSIKTAAARCRLPGTDWNITLRTTRLWDVVPGEIVTVKTRKQWTYAGRDYVSGEIESTRLDVAALGLIPLKLANEGIWDPEDEYWGEEGDPIDDWARPIITWGPRPQFEMERVLQEGDIDDPFSDPITQAVDLKDAGDLVAARKILMDLCEADLRCLDAHAHLGNLVFDYDPAEAIRHYEAGFRIGELSLGDNFDGLLPWGFIDNRPFLRCMHGYGLCLWRLERFDETEGLFERMLWLNPSDNQGVRFVVDHVRARRPWEELEEV